MARLRTTTAALLAAVVAGACAHTPPTDPTHWLAGAPPPQTVAAAAIRTCRTRTPVGSRIPLTVCRTAEEDARERAHAVVLLGLIGGGYYRDET